MNTIDQKNIADSDFFLALIEEDFFTNEQALAQLQCAIFNMKPIYILKLRSVDLQMEYFANADIRSINEFNNTGELISAVGDMMKAMKGES